MIKAASVPWRSDCVVEIDNLLKILCKTAAGAAQDITSLLLRHYIMSSSEEEADIVKVRWSIPRSRGRVRCRVGGLMFVRGGRDRK